jgi:antirestriction protein ArdC
VLCRRRHNTHWSGAEHRLGRTFGQRFGDAAYAFEELVAEIGSAAIGLRIGLRPQILDSHAAYLGHWVKILKDLRIPRDRGHGFHGKVGMISTRRWARIPREGGRSV